ncbi:hypothetical protein IPZ58_29845 [Streptomyces roseoverticillatus]|uniref:hypothetical protein n=1 Tax=Streptomyces roseoverticillatus TaxID=66429 RepID=UPI001F38A359|nr:hypothetical protein [Streptomyces roseoverticillatus]MCF3105758.1 hypothetical protein [Streptomyces roseoverticillatus]
MAPVRRHHPAGTVLIVDRPLVTPVTGANLQVINDANTRLVVPIGRRPPGRAGSQLV